MARPSNIRGARPSTSSSMWPRHGPVNAREISRATGVPESSLSYLLATLVDREWVAQAGGPHLFGRPALARLAPRSARAPLVDTRAAVFLRTSSASTGETSPVCSSGADTRSSCWRSSWSTHDLQVHAPRKGTAHAAARLRRQQGALLARMPPAEFDHLSPARPRAQLLHRPHHLRGGAATAQVAHCRERSCAVSLEEHSIGVNGVAVAIDDLHSVSIAIPSPRFSPDVERHTIKALEDAAVGLSPLHRERRGSLSRGVGKVRGYALSALTPPPPHRCAMGPLVETAARALARGDASRPGVATRRSQSTMGEDCASAASTC